MSDEVTIRIGIDTAEGEANLARLQEINNKVMEKTLKTRQEVLKTARGAQRIISGISTLVRAFANSMGISIGALGSAMIATVESIVSTAIAFFTLQVALASNPVTGVATGAYITLGFAAAALGVSIGTLGAVIEGNEKAQAQAANMQAALSGLQSITGGLSEIW